jgi:hypothetical protein
LRLLLLCIASVLVSTAAAQVQYLYDDAGNLVQVRKLAAGELSISQFFPLVGAPGSQVTIYGTGFNATPSANTVRFNGVAATVSTGTTSQLVVTVPPSATTGLISVYNGSATVRSARKFEIASGPVISSFSPTIGPVATPVTISGTGFDPVPINDRVTFGAQAAAVTSATATSIATSVPTNAVSGPLSLTVPTGQVTTANDFFVTPSGINVTNVVVTGRITVDGAALGVSLPATGKQAMIIFAGTQGSALTAQFLSMTGSSLGYVLYGVANTQIASGTVAGGQPWALLPPLPATGTYALIITATSGSASFSVRAESAVSLTADVGSGSATISTAGQSRRFVFGGAVGQNLGLGFTGLTLSTGTYANVTVYKPDGSSWLSDYCYTSGSYCAVNLANLPVTGTYSIVLAPATSATLSVQAWLSTDLTGALAAGTPSSLTTSRAGQNLRLTLAGTAGPSAALEFAGLAFNAGTPGINVVIYKPDGSTWTNTTISVPGTTWTLPPYPVNGTYTVLIEPRPSLGGAATVVSLFPS